VDLNLSHPSSNTVDSIAKALIPTQISSITGIAASSGWAIATAQVLDPHVPTAVYYCVEEGQIKHEQSLLIGAFKSVRHELKTLSDPLKKLVAQGLAHEEVYTLLEVQSLMLDDPALYDATLNKIAQTHVNAAWALSEQIQALAAEFESMLDDYFKERSLDIRQLGQRLLSHLLTPQRSTWNYTLSLPATDTAIILVAQDLPPAYFAQWQPNSLAGLITELGGYSSHTAIMARSHSIPAVLGVNHALQLIKTGDILALNGQTGEVWINPDDAKLTRLRTEELAWNNSQMLANSEASQATITQCGKTITVLGNIEQPSDMAAVLSAHLDGVGLFRTEFLFMGRDHLPSEAEQTAAYTEVIQALNGKVAVLRTLDVGADKLLNAVHKQTNDSTNPALGLRAVRYCLANPDLFLTQLRALLRAAHHTTAGTLKILLPMIASLDELHRCRAYLIEAAEQLNAEQIPYGAVELGIMIEIPAAAIAIDCFLPHIDFCSVGTNDLIQYTLAIDRTDAAVSNLYNPNHPAILQLLQHVFDACAKAKKSVSVCGEMASDTRYTATLLDLGLRSFSLHPNQAPAVKAAIRQWRSKV
jgi:phosphoenolpyruvate-protein phosphotransferase (PTS system enzyme I)